jgi:DNA-binding IscR family transcriptional regulator
MNYKAFAEHSECYEINGEYYEVVANFLKNKIFINSKKGPTTTVSLDEYMQFDGNMEAFARWIVERGFR